MRRPSVGIAPVATAIALLAASAACESDPPPAPDVVETGETRRDADAEQPPVVWVGGRIQRIAPDALDVLTESGSVVSLRRLTGGATRFFTGTGGDRREMTEEEVDEVAVARPVCAEALLDGPVLVALRVFVDAACGAV